MRIEELGLTKRAENALKAANIRTVEELLALSEKDVRGIQEFGRHAYAILIRKLQEHGYPVPWSLPRGSQQSELARIREELDQLRARVYALELLNDVVTPLSQKERDLYDSLRKHGGRKA